MNEINWLSMIIASCVPPSVDGMMYHKKAFGSTDNNSIIYGDKNMISIMRIILTLICSFFMAFFFLNFNNDGINQEGAFDTFSHGAWHGVFVVVTLSIPIIVITGIQAGRNTKHILLSLLYWIITLVLIGGIVDSMNHWENIILPE